MKRLLLSLLFLSSLASAEYHRPFATGVGSGGDIVDSFVNVEHYHLFEVLLNLRKARDLNSLCECTSHQNNDLACEYLQSLNEGQRSYCRQFILLEYEQMLALNSQPPITSLDLTATTLLYPDPQGVNRPVAAMTNKGPNGPIRLAYNDVQWFWPMELLAVIGHEFGHKVAFPAFGQFVDDNQPIGPFNFAGGGRKFLDAVGAAFAERAFEIGLVGRYGGVEDVFACEVTETTSGFKTGTSGPSARLFLDETLDVYDTGLGSVPRDTQCYVIENGGSSRLNLSVRIHEDNGCRNPTTTSLTHLELTRSFSDPAKPPVVLQAQEVKGSNLVCANPGAEVLTLSYANHGAAYRFEIKFIETIRGLGRK